MNRWLRLVVAVFVGAIVVAPAVVHASTCTYDVCVIARVEVHATGAGEAELAQLSVVQWWHVSPPALAASTSTTPHSRSVATESGAIYRTGSRTDGALTDPTGVSFRDSISSSADGAQVFKPGDKIWAVDTAELPPGSVVRDGVPAGHVSVNATPGAIRAAVFDDPILSGSGMKLLEDGSYRLPK